VRGQRLSIICSTRRVAKPNVFTALARVVKNMRQLSANRRRCGLDDIGGGGSLEPKPVYRRPNDRVRCHRGLHGIHSCFGINTERGGMKLDDFTISPCRNGCSGRGGRAQSERSWRRMHAAQANGDIMLKSWVRSHLDGKRVRFRAVRHFRQAIDTGSDRQSWRLITRSSRSELPPSYGNQLHGQPIGTPAVRAAIHRRFQDDFGKAPDTF